MLLNMVMFKVTICDFGKMNINMTDKIEKKESSELTTKSDQLVGVDNIEPLIKIIRGQQVMLDRDLATLYGVETKRLNEQVKRNIKRFPEDFMFQLTKDECLRSQIATLNEGRGQHLKYMPYVFTENGVAMLSSVLRSDTAIEVNIRIMRAFVSMRHFMVNNAFRLSHDRFLCIDDDVYHIGASIKDLGKKWFGFSKMEILTPDELVERINKE